ncbi:hypothetical protein ITJ66_14535 [Plantibacter sp. VKM Ac-2885]|uniref:hypothetical protein n=1 Tax=Plantibacter TaxID=190323 RepID=UPI0017839895|nr:MULTISPECIES: hypothetical protein [Plantibacter]MBD8104314.1 hypothetical protein [Plantibacter sp. CFBP 8775]MBF4513705.1 hypothetical protein [Plantibacter sp. VKM Ac-2885]CAH0228492.1 hypothetical protein SRABI02_02628 [Plantibacter cousiniae]
MWLAFLVKIRWVAVTLAAVLTVGGAVLLIRGVEPVKAWSMIGAGVISLVLQHLYARAARETDARDTIG